MPVEPDSNFQCHIPYLSIGGAQKSPISFGLAPGCHLPLGSSPAPATNLVYQPLIPSTLPTFHSPPLGVLQEGGFLYLPHTCQLAPAGNVLHQAPAPVGTPGQILGKVVQPLHPPTVEGYVQGNGQCCFG